MNFPERVPMGMVRNFSLETYLHYRDKHREDPADFTKFHDSDFRWLMGYRVPTWQRPLGAWSEEQQVKFLESCLVGLPIGQILTNSVPESVKRDGVTGFHRLDRILLDGQHRLHTLDRFFGQELPVFGYYWDDFPQREQIRFLRIQMPAHETEITNEDTLKAIYDRLAFGGTAHTEDQRASDDHRPAMRP